MKCGHLLLRDTSGSFTLAIRLPTKDYKPRTSRKQYLKQYNERPENRARHRILTRRWAANNRAKSREIKKRWRINNPDYMRNYRQRNRDRLLKKRRQNYRNRKKSSTLLKKQYKKY